MLVIEHFHYQVVINFFETFFLNQTELTPYYIA